LRPKLKKPLCLVGSGGLSPPEFDLLPKLKKPLCLVDSGGLSPPEFDLFPKLKKPLRGKRFRSIDVVCNEVTLVIRRIKNEGVQTGIQDFPKRWTPVIKHSGDYIEGL
jgi:hypothetical protein